MRNILAPVLVLLLLCALISGFSISTHNDADATSKPDDPLAIADKVEFIGQFGGATDVIAVQGHYAYINVGPRLVILDVVDPAQPVVVGQSRIFPDIIEDITLSGDYVYVADEEGGLRVVDVSDPANPHEAGEHETSGGAKGVAVAGGYAYVAVIYLGLEVVDVRNVSNLRTVGRPTTTIITHR